jgi:hypothetical protein
VLFLEGTVIFLLFLDVVFLCRFGVLDVLERRDGFSKLLFFDKVFPLRLSVFVAPLDGVALFNPRTNLVPSMFPALESPLFVLVM